MRDEVIGHKQVFDFFDKVIENGNLSHAYCFVGPDSVGKLTVAKEISAQLLEVSSDKLNITPDFSLVQQIQDEKTGKTKKNISIEQLQALRSFLTGSPFVKKYKIAVIDEAEKMSIGASNALLKTLEEPSINTIIFLITKDESLLPATIQSRCQMVYFHPVSSQDIFNFLFQDGGKFAEEIVKYSYGLPGRAIAWKDDPESFEKYKAERDRFAGLIGKPFYQKLKNVDELFGDKTDHVATRNKLQEVLGIWQTMLSSFEDNLEIDTNQKVDIYDQILYTIEMLNKNVHPRLLVEQVLLKLP